MTRAVGDMKGDWKIIHPAATKSDAPVKMVAGGMAALIRSGVAARPIRRGWPADAHVQGKSTIGRIHKDGGKGPG